MGLFSNLVDSDSETHTCPVHDLNDSAAQPFLSNGMSFHHFNIILSGVCMGFACLTIFSLMFIHGIRLTKPNEQIKIMKIASIVPAYSLISFIAVVRPGSYVYLEPWLDFFQSVALGYFFLLLCEYVSPSEEQRDLFFAALQVKDKKAPGGIGGGLAWYRKTWIMLFQYPVVALLASVVTDITQAAGVYCEYESKPYFAHLWIMIIQNVSLALAVTAALKFYIALKSTLAGHHPLTKFLAFKLIVLTTFVERIIFWILSDTGALNGTSTMTFADLNVGIPNLIVCLEMVPFALFFHYAYSYRPYVIRHDVGAESGEGLTYVQSYQGGPLGVRAWLAALSPKELLHAIAFAFKNWEETRSGSDRRAVSSWTQPQQLQEYGYTGRRY